LDRISGAACRLPWSGVWIKGDRELNITQQSLGSLGSCRSKNNDQYLLSSSTDRGDCFRCLIVFPVHENVLQYKTTLQNHAAYQKKEHENLIKACNGNHLSQDFLMKPGQRANGAHLAGGRLFIRGANGYLSA
ncbi:hypothetical protein ANCDUO_22386, partial [Ancylostoma duodenale]